MTIGTTNKYAIIIHEIIDAAKSALPPPYQLTGRRVERRHRFVEAVWSDFRPYPEDTYPSQMERVTRQGIERLIQKPGTYLVTAVRVSRPNGTLLDTWSWTVTVTAAPTPPPPPPTITWKM